MIVYQRSNGYGNIDTNSDDFQLGRKLFDAQKALADCDRVRNGGAVRSENIVKDLEEVARWFCRLVACVGELRADYDALRDCLIRPDLYQFVNDLEDSPERAIHLYADTVPTSGDQLVLCNADPTVLRVTSNPGTATCRACRELYNKTRTDL